MSEGWGKVTAEEEGGGAAAAAERKEMAERGRQGSDMFGIIGIESPMP